MDYLKTIAVFVPENISALENLVLNITKMLAKSNPKNRLSLLFDLIYENIGTFN